jgi:hypothetical protein
MSFHWANTWNNQCPHVENKNEVTRGNQTFYISEQSTTIPRMTKGLKIISTTWILGQHHINMGSMSSKVHSCRVQLNCRCTHKNTQKNPFSDLLNACNKVVCSSNVQHIQDIVLTKNKEKKHFIFAVCAAYHHIQQQYSIKFLSHLNHGQQTIQTHSVAQKQHVALKINKIYIHEISQ